MSAQDIAQTVEDPATIADRMFDLFCTPPAVPEDAKAGMSRMQTRLDRAEAFRVPFEGDALQAYRFIGTGRGTVVLVHGWTGQAAVMSAFVDPLLDAGFDVVAFDLPAHGRSSGDRLHVPLGVRALHALHAATGPWHGLIGHSFGGAVITSALSGLVDGLPRLTASRLALVAAPNSMPRIFDTFSRHQSLSPAAQLHLKSHVRRLTGRAVEAFIGADILRRDPVPTLVLHAPDDKEVDYLSAEEFATAGPHVTVHPLPGLGHRRILYARDTLRAVADFMAA
ncbi:alpha/beta fold hydrolase [Asticcacaulis sp. BYS171W]|uniref:Alpha/beta fold hydrolase n=1 Tax=Asticcacaulis aquaticus TaxID=2984212 RepID=A0ABT5HY28_9CAUL|nr:alpha/beta fold hydrolase [Asticcacaulis aquaticus]MDC7684833.1 alpha/beta fold hydrolase [Asticcacaulis aquaticus]